MLRLLRVMFPYMLLVCLAAAFMGMLNARGHFFIPAMGATMLNVVMIASVLWLAPTDGMGNFRKENGCRTRFSRWPIGVLAAGVAQAAFQLPTLWRDGFRYRWVSPWRDETVRRVVHKMIPGTIGVAAFQINVTLVLAIAFWVNPQIVASFNYAVRLMELPQGMFGISLATYLLPTLSGLAAEKNYPEFRATLRHGMGTLLFLNLIAAILLVVLAEPIVRLLFEHGQIHRRLHRSACARAHVPRAGAGGVFTVNILARAFYALGDTKTPMKISIACLVLNLSWPRAGGAAEAGRPRHRQHGDLILQRRACWFTRCGKTQTGNGTAAQNIFAAGNGGALAGPDRVVRLVVLGKFARPRNLALKIGAVFVPAGIAGLVYWLAALAFKIPAAKEMTEFALAKVQKI
jgi:murein biosynthesis integral membrane protein MurJ